MNQEKFWVLFSKNLSGEASAEELALLEDLINEHPEWQYAIQNLIDIWKHQTEKDHSIEEDAYLLHLHRMAELNVPFEDTMIVAFTGSGATKKSSLKWYYGIAAVIILLISLFAFKDLFTSNKKQSAAIVRQVNEVSTRLGSKSKVELPDGSVVWLNAGSKLTYDKEFGKQTRAVTLIGEGFFDVTKNKEKPFIITTANISIKVLGTTFNVKAYPEDKQTETSLIHGSIEVTIKNRAAEPIVLFPSEKLVVKNNDNEKNGSEASITRSKPEIAIQQLKYNSNDSTVDETVWVENKLVFREEAFSDIVRNMERWYNVEIEIADADLRQRQLSGTFTNETVEQALEALKITNPFVFERKENKIIIQR